MCDYKVESTHLMFTLEFEWNSERFFFSLCAFIEIPNEILNSAGIRHHCGIQLSTKF